jgi:two-component system phosphate regulon sensor histidine kinase PhoR
MARLIRSAGIRAKLFLASLALMAASVSVTDAVVTRRLSAEVIGRFRAELLVRLALVTAEATATPLPLEPTPAWDAVADGLGARAQGRVTIMRSDGLVLGDSDVAIADLAKVENHAHRPEMVEALKGNRGSNERMSATVQRRLMYVALPMVRNGAVVGVARLAVPLTAVDEWIGHLRRTVTVASTLALGLAVLLAMGAAHAMSRRARRLTEVASRMAEGDLTLQAPERGTDELAALGRALNQLVTSLARTLDQLRSQRDVVGRVLESMREGVLVLDGKRRVALVNPALREMLLLGSDILGQTALEATKNAELARTLEDVAARREAVASELEVGGLKPRRLLVNAGPLGGEGGGLVAVFVDVTEMRRLETMRRDFVANVSHELRTPLAAVVAATETLQGGALANATSAQQFLGMIERNVQRLQSLVEDVLELSKIESRELRLSLEPIDLLPVATHVVGLFEHRAARKRMHLSVAVAEDAGRVVADRSALEHILSNLVDNAVKYCPDGTTVAVRAVPAGPSVRVSVADTGPGIEAKHLPRLFERFYRVDPGRARDVGGTGLGLSIVKHLGEAMGGSVSVGSTVGEGTVFTVTLKRA